MTGAVTKMAHAWTQAFPAASSGWEMSGRGGQGEDAGRKEDLPPLRSPLSPPKAHISGVEGEVGAFLQPWSRISFSLDIDGPEIGSYSHGRRRSPPPPMIPLFLLLFPSCHPTAAHRRLRGSLAEYENSEVSSFQPFQHLFLSSYHLI